MKMITRDLIPCWYELSWQEKEPAIVLRLHKDFIANTSKISEEAPIVQSFKQAFKFKNFIGNFEDNFGFDNAFKFIGQKGDFSEFLIKIPAVKKASRGICPDCGGSGKDPDMPRETCFNCHGSGKNTYYDWQRAYAISATFSVFTLLVRWPEKETSCLFPQLLTLETITQNDLHGGSLYGEYSQPLVKWLTSFTPNTQIPQMVGAMKIVYGKMLGRHKFDDWYFYATIANDGGWLNVSCPGDACGLHPANSDDYERRQGLGYEFSCHNVDNAAQQLTLIAGLAALHDRARERTQKLSGSEFARQFMPAEAKVRLEKITLP